MHFSSAHLRKVTTRTVVACNTKYIGTPRALGLKRLVACNEPLLVADPTRAVPKTFSAEVVSAARLPGEPLTDLLHYSRY